MRKNSGCDTDTMWSLYHAVNIENNCRIAQGVIPNLDPEQENCPIFRKMLEILQNTGLI